MKYTKQGWVCRLTMDDGSVLFQRRGHDCLATKEPNFYTRKSTKCYKAGYRGFNAPRVVSSEWLPCTETIEVDE